MRSSLLLLAVCTAYAGSVEGTVTNSATGEAIKRATVTLMSQSLRARYIAGADDRGQFQFPDVEPASDYVVEALARGFTMPAPTRQVLKEMHPIAVTKQENVTGVAVKLVPLGAINGKVIDADGEPVRGVRIQALQYQYRDSGPRRLDSKASALTDSNGQYRLYFLQPGRYLVRAYLHQTPPGPTEPSPHVHNFIPEEGFLPAYYPGGPEATQGAIVEVKPAAELNGYDLRLARATAFHVRGRVEGAQGKTQVSMSPCATLSMDLGFTFPADSHPDGTFDARGVTPGQYCLTMQTGGSRFVTAGAQVYVKDRDVNGVALTAQVRVSFQGSLQMDPSQAERPKKLTVTLANPDLPGMLFGVGPVQDDGTFAMQNVPAGPSNLSIGGRPAGSYLKSFKFAGGSTPPRFEVPRGGGNLTLTIGTDAGTVTGKVQDQDGNPGDHMMVTLAPKGDLAGRIDLIQTAPTDDAGSYQIKDVAPGEYNVFAWDSQDADATRAPAFLKLFESKASAITVQGSNAASVQLKAVPARDMEEATWKPQQ